MLAAQAPVGAEPRPPAPAVAEVQAGQDLIYMGRFGAAQLFFERLGREFPGHAAGPALQASALIWWAEARDEETWQADSVDALLDEAIRRATRAATAARTDPDRVEALFWLGTSYGYRARQAELRGHGWKAAHDAKAMRDALRQARQRDSTCADCTLGLGIYDYALARAGGLARFAARVIGLGSGDAVRGLALMREASEQGILTRHEAAWIHGSALLREGARGDLASREEGLRVIGALADRFPDNPVFRRALEAGPEP